MVFHSASFFVFLFCVLCVVRCVRPQLRWVPLVLASYVFYDAFKEPHLLAALALITGATYVFGLKIAAADDRHKRRYLWGGIGVNVLVLIGLKYIPFLSANLNWLLSQFAPQLSLPPGRAVVSIGASYFVFQAISYLSDIYLEIEQPERHFGIFALYMSFFPRLLQGPIERAGDLLPQLRAPVTADYANLRAGMLLFAWGLCKKTVLADRLGIYVDAVYADVGSQSGLPLLLGTYAYAFQIYLDFSGYTDMALGAARLFNIRLTPNFDRPYLATSIADFWRRWHITFSRWILDYIFKPLQMGWRQHGNYGSAAALLVTFLVSGIWHGASWGFVVWGMLHGIYMACAVFYQPFEKRLFKRLGWSRKGRLLKFARIVLTFHLVTFAWIFFRAETLTAAGTVVGKLLRSCIDGGWTAHGMELFFTAAARIDGAIIAGGVLLLTAVSVLRDRDFFAWPLPLRWLCYTGLTTILVWFSLVNRGQFIYFQF